MRGIIFGIIVAQMAFPGMEAGTIFQAGYVLDELQQKVVKKAIVCEFGNRVLYSIDLFADVDAAIDITQTSPPKPQKTGRFESNPEAIPVSEKVKKKYQRKGA